MKIMLSIAEWQIEGELYEHPVASELANLLPLELVFNDFNNVEKVATLGRSLTVRGVPDADAPVPGEIGYYSPLQTLVLYYENPGEWPGLVRMGRTGFDVDVLRDLPDGTRIRIAPSPPLPS
jgi:hypothetical protein